MPPGTGKSTTRGAREGGGVALGVMDGCGVTGRGGVEYGGDTGRGGVDGTGVLAGVMDGGGVI